MTTRPGHPPRLEGWSYSAAWLYFVTFKAARGSVLARPGAAGVSLTRAGEIVQASWNLLPCEFPVELDSLVIMPDHVHAIVRLLGEGRGDEPRPRGWRLMMADPTQGLGRVVRAWKARATRLIRVEVDTAFSWQSRYFDRVIRSEEEYLQIREYIADNPRR
jgi:putative transposase